MARGPSSRHLYLCGRPRPAGPAGAPGRQPAHAPPRRLPPAVTSRRPTPRCRLDDKARIRRPHAREPCRRSRRPGAVPRAGPVRARPGSPRIHASRGARGNRSPRLVRDPPARNWARRPSVLNPLWYAGSFGIGALAALLGDRASLGFVAETERQVEGHLESHLDRLPEERSCAAAPSSRPCATTKSAMASEAHKRRWRVAAGPGPRIDAANRKGDDAYFVPVLTGACDTDHCWSVLFGVRWQ